MSSWRTLLVAALISSVLAACGSKATSKKSSDEDDDDDSSSKSESSDSSSSSASASGSGAAPKTKAPAKAPKDAVVLDNGTHRVAVVVKSDGATEIVAFDTKDVAIAADEVKGKVRADEGEWVDVEKGDGDGVTAKLAKLDDGLTNVQVALKIEGKSFEESIDVPEGGTKALQEEPKIVIAEGTKGPNGGVVDVVGNQRVELVVDEETGDVRVYYLDENLKVMEIPEGTEVTLNFDDEDKK